MLIRWFAALSRYYFSLLVWIFYLYYINHSIIHTKTNFYTSLFFIFQYAAPTQVPSQTQRTRTPTPPTTPFYKNSPNPAKNFTNSPNLNPRCRCSGVQPCGKKCGWHHSSNALWRELENSPFNKRKNKEVAW